MFNLKYKDIEIGESNFLDVRPFTSFQQNF